jgi:hypothetical protein
MVSKRAKFTMMPREEIDKAECQWPRKRKGSREIRVAASATGSFLNFKRLNAIAPKVLSRKLRSQFMSYCKTLVR